MPPIDLKWVKGRALDIFVESFSNSARTVQVRGFTESEPIIIDHTTSANRSLATSATAITEVPLHITIRTLETGVSRGECYVKVSLRAEGVVVALLGAGYVTDAGTVMWPGGKVESSVEGPGLVRNIEGTDPAAGAEISETVPTGARWRLITLHAVLTADATAVTRNPKLVLNDGLSDYLITPVGATATASQTVKVTWSASGLEDISSVLAQVEPLPSGLLIPAGHGISTLTVNLQAGDNYAAPQFLVEEWIEP